jgi:ribosome-associated heat shock protein Hsp15
MSDGSRDEVHVRLDKWLWAARLFKTRTLAAAEIARGRVLVNGLPAKPAREVRPGDRIAVRQPQGPTREVDVRVLSHVRGPAPVAQGLYAETPESLAARERAAQARRDGVEPALALTEGRPTKRGRRRLGQWQRWSASVDDPTGPDEPP